MCKDSHCKMYTRIYALVVLVVAVVASLLLFTLNIDKLDSVILFIKFFESMLPILAVGALFKYLWSKNKKGGCCCCCKQCHPAAGQSCDTSAKPMGCHDEHPGAHAHHPVP